MRRLMLTLMLAFATLAQPALAQLPAADVSAADRTEIRGVIESQMAAFRRDDGALAFSFASPTIRQLFGDADAFMGMVRAGYAAVYRPQAVEFGEIVDAGGAPMQLVRVVGPDGRAVMAAYEMQRQPDGTWRINGCQILQLPERTT